MKFNDLESVRSIAIVGATGLVGMEFLQLLSDYKIKVPTLKLLASETSAGQSIDVNGHEFLVEELTENSFKGVEVCFTSIPTELTKKVVQWANKAGCLVIDDSSVYRMNNEVPLIVPEINGAELRKFTGNVISTPNCTVTPLVLCLKPLLDSYGIKRVVVSTYQSVSGAGKKACDELSTQAAAFLNAKDSEINVFPHRIAFNCIPEVGQVTENGNTEEEEKMINETRKILGLSNLKISAHCTRVPTYFGHALSVNVELKDSFDSIEAVRELLDNSPGIKVLDNPTHHVYPTHIEGSGTDYAFVGRLRKDASLDSGVNFWIVCDNLRKGASLNALQILETLMHYRRMS